MVEAQKEAKPKKRMTATQAAASIGPMVKEFITGTLRARAEGKQKLAYTFIVCHHEEILRAMDVLPVWTENFAGICGAKRDSERFLQRAESLGLSRSLCTYALCGIGFDQWREELGQMPPDAPWGGQARPDFMISTGQILCDPRAKWYQASQQYMPDGLERLQFYHPTQLGQEKEIARRLEWYRKHGSETDTPQEKSVREQENGKEDREESQS